MRHSLHLILLFILAACNPEPAVTPTPAMPAPDKLVIAGWAGYMPQALLDAFSAETGIAVEYVVYESQFDVIDQLRAGTGDYDVVVMGNTLMPTLVADGLLAPIDYSQIPNFRYVSANFRDLSYDPGSRYSVVYQWGVGGLVVRPDLLDRPITRWADLWDPALAGKIAMWLEEDQLFMIALKAMGQSFTVSDPAVFDQAAERLSKLLPNVVALDLTLPNAADLVANGTYPVLYGWSYDALAGQALNPAVTFVLPEEGAMLWIDTLVVPERNERKAAAFQFINFVLRPEMCALITNEIYVATANDQAMPLIDPALQHHPWIFSDWGRHVESGIYAGTAG
ncbi:spermidine/putrescine ABC transporter substrate-binding protein [Chloroflexus sp.]|uniref:ABC transporter substrate-binding protein n=1 Tax=Chloroflexus sp. TaxID=1904827 RepID=UPI002ACDA9DE|nr:spermidine/putrescine ABC transporter substrate-binding protein [Chloroflexus sp.]